MNYTLTFLFDTSLKNILLLRKPITHHNPLFRGRWTAPGGKIEDNDGNPKAAAIRETYEEAKIRVSSEDMRCVLSFPCNCDPTEAEHDVYVYAARLPYVFLESAHGQPEEPVKVFDITYVLAAGSGINLVWYVKPIISLAIVRLEQTHA
jgi:8-oxo-dGTP pyrophosphatase MutT (NUDIX family)